jgi:outer membrane lipoprotein-sorting protein
MSGVVLAVVLAFALGVAALQSMPGMAGLSSVTAAAAADATLDEVIGRIEDTYTKLGDLRATFSQAAFNKSLNQTIPAEGTVYLKKGGKMR